MKNSQRFLLAFNTVHKELEKLVGTNRFLPFYRLVDIAKKKSGLIKTYEDDLKELSQLRNAIVHDRSYPERTIAEPHDAVVEKLEKIVDEITSPKQLIPFFEKEVIAFQATDTIKQVLRAVKEYGYTQFPVYADEQFSGLITVSSISKWMAFQIAQDPYRYLYGHVSEVIAFENKKKNYCFMNRRQTIHDAKERYFTHSDYHQVRLDAILITENGKEDEPLLGIATPLDIFSLNKEIIQV